MAKKDKPIRPKAQLPKGLRDVGAEEIRAMAAMLSTIRDVYDGFGFEPLETPAFEYTDALGKFLPDQDRPNAGVFSFEDEDGQWLSLRYDLTAPLARYVAENYDALAKPFRRYQTGPVWRNEKPGPGRFRQFTQFDADTVGSSDPAADSEICMLAADTLERLGIPRDGYIVRINNRKVLDGVLESIGIDPTDDGNAGQRLIVLRALDKLDRLGLDGVARLLGDGRKDESGDFTKGAGLATDQIDRLLAFVSAGKDGRSETLKALTDVVTGSDLGIAGIEELTRMDTLLTAANYGADQIAMDPSIVRGLDYYTGPVFEAELTFEAQSEDGATTRFGSVGGGGRYDGLVARFKGVEIPATGFSIGVSRLYTALQSLGQIDTNAVAGPVIVLVMDRANIGEYQAMARQLRDAGIRSEMYVGTSGMRAQMKYADKRASPCVVIQGSDERERGEIMIKDLIEGSALSATISDNKEWRQARPAQFSVPRDKLIEAVKDVLARHSSS